MNKVCFKNLSSVIACIVLLSNVLIAQSLRMKDVPKSIAEHFHAHYPKAKSVVLEKDSLKGLYVVSFKDEGSFTKSTYNVMGKWLKTAILIENEDLPMNVFNVVKKEYPTYDDIVYAYLVKEVKDLQYYLVGVSVKSEQIFSDMRFTLIGSFIRKEEKPLSEELLAAGGKESDVRLNLKDKLRKNQDSKKSERGWDNNLISQDKVPANVIKMFKKRMMNASEVRWYNKTGDSIYSVKCILRGQGTLGKFTDKGIWISTRTELEKDRVPSAVYKTINTFYPSYKFLSAGKEIRGDKQDFFAVEIIEEQNARDGSITTLYLDKSARIQHIEEPDLKTSDAFMELTPEDKKAEQKLEKEFAKDRKLDIYPVKSIRPDEIPNAIHKWTDTYYPEYIYKNIVYGEEEEFEDEGEVYTVLIQRPGVGQPYATVYFTRTGAFLKLVDEFKSDEEIAEQMAAKVRKDAVVPMNIAEAFRTKVKDALEVSWQVDDDDNWIATYTDKKNAVKQTVYSQDAAWMYTRTKLDISRVPSVVKNYVNGNFSNTEIKECWSASNSTYKQFYMLNLYNKKTRLEFDMNLSQSGKSIEE